MEFLNAYKRLEKLCREILRDVPSEYGPIKTYYDIMAKIPQGEVAVPGWNQDYQKLKHYCWVRNQIAHEPGCNEDNMCEPEDAIWLDDFYNRIINQTDPLSLYRKTTARQLKKEQGGESNSQQWTENGRPQYDRPCYKTSLPLPQGGESNSQQWTENGRPQYDRTRYKTPSPLPGIVAIGVATLALFAIVWLISSL